MTVSTHFPSRLTALPVLSHAEKAQKLVAIRAMLADRLRLTRASERRQRAKTRASH